MSFNPDKPIPVLDPGDVLGYWDMTDYMPASLEPGKYMTARGRVATVEYVGAQGDAFGYIQRYGVGPSLCCVWTWDGLVRCAFGEHDAWDWSIVDRWEDGITTLKEEEHEEG